MRIPLIDVNKIYLKDRTALFHAVNLRNLDVVQILLRRPDIIIPQNALVEACKQGDIPILKALIQRDPNAAINLLFVACGMGNLTVVQHLLDAGFDPNISRTIEPEFLLDYFSSCDLIDKMVSFQFSDKPEGAHGVISITPLELAQLMRHDALCEFLTDRLVQQKPASPKVAKTHAAFFSGKPMAFSQGKRDRKHSRDFEDEEMPASQRPRLEEDMQAYML